MTHQPTLRRYWSLSPARVVPFCVSLALLSAALPVGAQKSGPDVLPEAATTSLDMSRSGIDAGELNSAALAPKALFCGPVSDHLVCSGTYAELVELVMVVQTDQVYLKMQQDVVDAIAANQTCTPVGSARINLPSPATQTLLKMISLAAVRNGRHLLINLRANPSSGACEVWYLQTLFSS